MQQVELIEVERVGVAQYRLTWPTAIGTNPVRIHVSHAPDETAALSADIAIAAGTAEINNVPESARHFFHLHWDDGSRVVVADRHIPLQGARNFRDFGGYTTGDGRRVRWGHLYRSSQLSTLTDVDQQIVAALGIRLICDFRRDTERDSDPNRLAEQHRPRIENLPIAPGNTSHVLVHFSGDPDTVSKDEVVQCMIDINRDLALQQRESYRRMFDALLEENGPLLVHCAVGKDRTGFAAALILAVLGVPERTILRDYLLTERYLPAQREVVRLLKKYPSRLAAEQLLPLLEAREIYLQAALAAIRDTYGNMDTYLRDYLGIDALQQRELRARLLMD